MRDHADRPRIVATTHRTDRIHDVAAVNVTTEHEIRRNEPGGPTLEHQQLRDEKLEHGADEMLQPRIRKPLALHLRTRTRGAQLHGGQPYRTRDREGHVQGLCTDTLRVTETLASEHEIHEISTEIRTTGGLEIVTDTHELQTITPLKTTHTVHDERITGDDLLRLLTGAAEDTQAIPAQIPLRRRGETMTKTQQRAAVAKIPIFDI